MLSIRIQSTVFSCFLLVAVACKNEEQANSQAEIAAPVTVHTISASDASYYDEYPALVRALNEVELRAQISGYITGVYFAEGDIVEKGQRLYSIDQQQSQAIYQEAVANLSVQQSDFEKAKKDVLRYRALDVENAVAKQQVDYAEAAYKAAKMHVEAEKAKVQNMRTNVTYSTITAPFKGTIGISQVKLGASVSPGVTILNTISSDGPVAADIVIDQSEIVKFLRFIKQQPNKADSTFRFNLKQEVYPYPGRISFIDRAVDPQTGTIKLRMEFPNPENLLRPGMNGVLRVLTRATKAIVIPNKAVSEQLGEFFVYIVKSSTVTQRRIVPGKQIGTQIIVEQGLQPGEVIVTEGIQNLKEGSAIKVSGKGN